MDRARQMRPRCNSYGRPPYHAHGFLDSRRWRGLGCVFRGDSAHRGLIGEAVAVESVEGRRFSRHFWHVWITNLEKCQCHYSIEYPMCFTFFSSFFQIYGHCLNRELSTECFLCEKWASVRTWDDRKWDLQGVALGRRWRRLLFSACFPECVRFLRHWDRTSRFIAHFASLLRTDRFIDKGMVHGKIGQCVEKGPFSDDTVNQSDIAYQKMKKKTAWNSKNYFANKIIHQRVNNVL